jgi:hypothetical protein
MTHKASQYLISEIHSLGLISAQSLSLSSVQSSTLSALLVDDARSYFYSASISFLEVIRGCTDGYYSWSTVKAYYCTFYAIRSLLATNGFSVFRHNNTEHLMEARLSATPRIMGPSTHTACFRAFSQRLSSSILNSAIGTSNTAHSWMKEKREETNYRTSRFLEPAVPYWMSRITIPDIGTNIQSYVLDSTNLYTFDLDHAIIAYPIACLKAARQSLEQTGVSLESVDIQFITSCAANLPSFTPVLPIVT